MLAGRCSEHCFPIIVRKEQDCVYRLYLSLLLFAFWTPPQKEKAVSPKEGPLHTGFDTYGHTYLVISAKDHSMDQHLHVITCLPVYASFLHVYIAGLPWSARLVKT